MLNYIIRRILWLIPVFIAVSLITFILMHMTPGGPWDTTPKPLPPATKALLDAKYHLDEPLPQQYIEYMLAALHGDLGPAFTGTRTVNQIIVDTFPISAALGLIALAISIFIGIPLGVISALRHNSLIDNLSMFTVTLGISVPTFVIGIALIIIFAVSLHVLPIGFHRDQWQTWILPSVVLAFGPLAYIVRLTRSSTLEVMGEDYVRTARAKGLPAFVVNIRHVLRNALIPIVTLLGPLTAFLITGNFIVEAMFSVPGIGRTFIDSVSKRDYALLMGTAIFFTFIVVSFNLLVDLTYSFIDPRITRN